MKLEVLKRDIVPLVDVDNRDRRYQFRRDRFREPSDDLMSNVSLQDRDVKADSVIAERQRGCEEDTTAR